MRRLQASRRCAQSGGRAYRYNCRVKPCVLLAAVALLALGGCNRGGGQTKEAVQSAVVDYLAKRGTINLSSMQVEVVSVAFRENEADATVSFRPRGTDASNPGMTMAYKLVRKGGGWEVQGRPAGADAHGAGMQIPEGAPPDHPPISGAAPAEPAK